MNPPQVIAEPAFVPHQAARSAATHETRMRTAVMRNVAPRRNVPAMTGVIAVAIGRRVEAAEARIINGTLGIGFGRHVDSEHADCENRDFDERFDWDPLC
jgi:hypothetical protein